MPEADAHLYTCCGQADAVAREGQAYGRYVPFIERLKLPKKFSTAFVVCAGDLSIDALQSRLAQPAASPGRAATAVAPAATTASPPAPAATGASTAPTAPVVGRLYASLERCVVLLVEDVEGRQADVGNFFLTEEEFVMRCGVLHRHIHCRSSS